MHSVAQPRIPCAPTSIINVLGGAPSDAGSAPAPLGDGSGGSLPERVRCVSRKAELGSAARHNHSARMLTVAVVAVVVAVMVAVCGAWATHTDCSCKGTHKAKCQSSLR